MWFLNRDLFRTATVTETVADISRKGRGLLMVGERWGWVAMTTPARVNILFLQHRHLMPCPLPKMRVIGSRITPLR
jgi:hypothetical protein